MIMINQDKDEMEIESLENSPGNTLKRKIDVNVMPESPNPQRRIINNQSDNKLENAPPRTNHKQQVSLTKN